MNCISCSACGKWHHLECTKLSMHEFETKTYFFCNKKCENSVIVPSVNTSQNEKSETNSCCCDQPTASSPIAKKYAEEEKRKSMKKKLWIENV